VKAVVSVWGGDPHSFRPLCQKDRTSVSVGSIPGSRRIALAVRGGAGGGGGLARRSGRARAARIQRDPVHEPSSRFIGDAV